MPSGASASFAWSDGTSVSQFNNLLGTRVRLVGLTNRPELNGQCGEVLSWDSASGRAGVKLDNEAARPIKVKPANLQPVGGEDDPGVGAPDDSTPATFHPNIMFTYPARVLGVTTVTTNDFMSSGYEERHFIDRAFLERLPGGADLLASVVPAQPPCFKLVGAGFRATVLGMLWNALPVTMDVVPDGPIVDPSSGHTLDLSLAHILVVENLPVEIHVSWKVLFSTETAKWSTSFGRCPENCKFRAEQWPERYRSHPYWAGRGTIMMMPTGLGDRSEMARHNTLSANVRAHQGQDATKTRETGEGRAGSRSGSTPEASSDRDAAAALRTELEAAASLQADALAATQAAAASQAEVVAAAEAAAAAARAQEQQTTILNEDLQCPICLAVMCNAVSLTTCLHKFCEQCITECRRSSSVCPTCRRPYTVQQIQTDHLIRSLIERHV